MHYNRHILHDAQKGGLQMRKEPVMVKRSSYSAMGRDRYDYEPTYAFDPVWKYGASLHCHDFYELYIHLRGVKYYCIDNNVYPIEPNQLLVMPPLTMHGHIGAYRPVNYERAFLYISPATLRRAGADVMDLVGFLSKCTARGQYHYQMSATDAKTCTRLIQEMTVGLEDESPMGRFANHSRMLNFLQIICQNVQRSARETKPVIVNRAMQEVLSYIDEHFTQPHRLETIARRFGVSVSYLSHEFVKYTGRSVYDYILNRRVLQAKEMIYSGVLLNEVAYRCGFSDYSSFLRCFKKMSGMSPNAYRKMIKQNQSDL